MNPYDPSLKGAVLKLPRRLSVLAATILGAGSLVLGAGAPMAHASTPPGVTFVGEVGPDFVCPSGETCIYKNEDYTGLTWEIDNSSYAGGAWNSFASIGVSPNPGSIRIHGGSTLFLLNRQTNVETCMYNARLGFLYGYYGYFAINYGVNTCPNP